MSTLPVIDVAPLLETNNSNTRSQAYQHALQQVDDACHHTGFMLLTGHGIPAQSIAAVRAATKELFSLPLTVRQAYKISQKNYRGYIPLGFFNANEGGFDADQYEGYKLHYEVAASDALRDQCPLYGPNKWPAELPALGPTVLDYWRHCDRLCAALLRAFAAILKLPDTTFDAVFRQPLSNMTLLHYPPQRQGYGIHPHKDTDALTILAPDPLGGLQLRPRNSQQWLRADAKGDALVVNIGDMLEIWSGGYFVSTPHKVINHSGQSRISFPYFAVPRFDTVVQPLVDCAPDFTPRHVHVGEVSAEVWRTNWPHAVPVDNSVQLGTLND